MKRHALKSIIKKGMAPSDALEMLIDSGKVSIAVLIPSDNYNIIYASDQLIEDTEITDEEIAASRHCAINRVHPEDADKLKAAFDKALTEENTVDVRLICNNSGAVKWLRCKAFPADFAAAEGAVALITRNVTSEVTLKNDLLIRNERYKIYEMTTPDVLFEYDPNEDKMIFSSNGATGITQNVIENYMEQFRTSPLVHPEDRERFISALLSACRAPVTATLEYRSMVIGGGYKWCRTYYSGAADESGKIYAVFGRIQDISTEFARNRELIRKAELDPLTGLYNRASFENHAVSAMEKVREKEKLLFAVADIDDFKHFNDKYGHRRGDDVLTTVSSLIEKYFSGEITGRFGGDEFVIFTAAADCADFCDKLSALAKEANVCINGEDIRISMSIGVYITSDKSVTYPQLFEWADQAMYTAKNSGKDTVYIREEN
ncbi:MAG: sensor domain-containing diguanylate cyclase [Oscillospiraceae bacterium]|nr:sensor domain-containing diguanylate cyclase [Oscillospiraceae bacterium]